MAHQAREAKTSAYVRRYEPPEPINLDENFGETKAGGTATYDVRITPSTYAKLLFPFLFCSDSFGLLSRNEIYFADTFKQNPLHLRPQIEVLDGVKASRLSAQT